MANLPLDDNVREFPQKKKRQISPQDVEVIGFITADDRDLYIEDPADIARIFVFIKQQGIKIYEET